MFSDFPSSSSSSSSSEEESSEEEISDHDKKEEAQVQVNESAGNTVEKTEEKTVS